MKKTFKAGIAVVLIAFISCTKESLQTPSAANIPTKGNTTQKTAGHYIGERFGGGIIFFIDTIRNHGLIADTIDLGIVPWYNGTATITGATGKAIGTGKANTKKIILSQGTTGNYAALYCSKSTRSGYSDWFLPSKAELNELYKQKNKVGGFTTGFYWSSSEKTISYAWEQSFDDGFQNYYYKYLRNYVRAVRYF